MKLLTRDTDYAIRALGCAAGNKDKVVTVRVLAAKLGLPGAYLRKILQILNREGIFRSTKGRGGGFTLAIDPEDISIIRVVEIFQGPFVLAEHKSRGVDCPEIKTCRLKEKLDELGAHVSKELKAMTIADMVRK
jgi:Rrf2 family protein